MNWNSVQFNSNNIYIEEKWDGNWCTRYWNFAHDYGVEKGKKPFKRHKYEKDTKLHSCLLGNWLNKFHFGTPKDNFWQIVPYVLLLNLGFALLGTTNDYELINWWKKKLILSIWMKMLNDIECALNFQFNLGSIEILFNGNLPFWYNIWHNKHHILYM